MFDSSPHNRIRGTRDFFCIYKEDEKNRLLAKYRHLVEGEHGEDGTGLWMVVFLGKKALEIRIDERIKEAIRDERFQDVLGWLNVYEFSTRHYGSHIFARLCVFKFSGDVWACLVKTLYMMYLLSVCLFLTLLPLVVYAQISVYNMCISSSCKCSFFRVTKSSGFKSP